MTDPSRGSLRLLRALGLLATVTGLVLGAHVAGGGVVQPVPAVAVAAALWPACLVAARRQVRLPVLVPGLAAGQLAGHALLAYLGPSTVGLKSLAVACLEHAGHAHAAASTGADHAAFADSILPAGHMLASHLVATLLAALLVARGEAILWRLVDLVVRRRPRLVVPAPVHAVLRGLVTAPVAVVDAPRPTGRAPPLPA